MNERIIEGCHWPCWPAAIKILLNELLYQEYFFKELQVMLFLFLLVFMLDL